MRNSREQPSFDIREVVEQKPLEGEATQNFKYVVRDR